MRGEKLLRVCLFLTLAIAGVICSLYVPERAWAQTPPSGQIIIVSDEGQMNLAGQWVQTDVSLLRTDDLDPHPDWRNRDFNDSGWITAFPVQRVAPWAAVTLPNADHIWGGERPSGSLVPDAGPALPYPRRNNGAFGYPVVTTPAPQYIFFRKNFCIPINAQLNSNGDPAPTFVNDLQLLAAVDGEVRIWLNGLYPLWDVAGNESGALETVFMPPNVRDGTVLYRGNNTLSMRAREADPTDQAALLYYWDMGYTIDPGAIQINYTGQSYVNQSINFGYTHDGLSRRSPYNAVWDFGDGSGDTTSPHTYTAPGTYNVTLWLWDADNCPGLSGTTIIVEWEPSQLEIVKSPDRTVIMPGEIIRFDLTVRVIGAALPLNNIIIVDTLPASANFVSCNDGCVLNGNEVQWNLGAQNPGYEHTVQVQMQLDANFTGDRIVNNYRAASDETGIIAGIAVEVGVNQPLPTNTPTPTPTPAPMQAAAEPSEVPEPTTLILLGSGMAALGGYASLFSLNRRRKTRD